MINSTLCYIEKDGKYLMLHRVKKENAANKDKWIGIGGKFRRIRDISIRCRFSSLFCEDVPEIRGRKPGRELFLWSRVF